MVQAALCRLTRAAIRDNVTAAADLEISAAIIDSIPHERNHLLRSPKKIVECTTLARLLLTSAGCGSVFYWVLPEKQAQL